MTGFRFPLQKALAWRRAQLGLELVNIDLVGCNAVLNPGSILGPGAVIYPNVNWRGILPANMIAKNKAATEVVVRRPK